MSRRPRRRGDCYRCGRPGHFAYECPKNPHARSSSSNQRNAPGVGSFAQGSRSQERRFFDKFTKDDTAQIRDATEAERLLKAAVAFKLEEGAPGLLYRIADQKTIRIGPLRKALEYITDVNVFTNGFLPFLEIIGGDDIGKPVYEKPLEAVLRDLYAMKFLIPELLVHVQASRADRSDSRTALIWFLTKLALKVDEARSDATLIQLADVLTETGPGTECLKTVLAGGIESHGDVSLSGVRDLQAEVPGGRHDNDLQDFRSIKIIPTIDEFLCPANPYLPKASKGAATAAQLLDRQFRLLREDILGPAKEEQDDPRKLQRDLFEGVRASHVVDGEPVTSKVDGKQVRITGSTDPCICFSFRIPHWHRVQRLKTQREKETYWDQTRRILPRDALVCLLRQSEKKEWVPIRFGTIVRRETKELAVTGKTKPVIGIAFFSQDHVLESLKELSDSKVPPTRLLVVSAELFAYQPILRGLQLMETIPFEEEILLGSPPLEQTTEVLRIPADLQSKAEQLDEGQRDALNYSLSNRVTLIQGPPGTGKTFIGVVLAQIILASTNEKILCVCYTNHALDDFLEGLLDVGIRDIVRVGGRSKNERLAEFNLREKAKAGKAPFSREQTRRYAQLKETIEGAAKEVERLQKICSREIGKSWWPTVEPHLKGAHPEAWRQLRVDPSSLTDKDGFNIVGVKKEDHLWKLWIAGKPACAPFQDRNEMHTWKLSKQERVLLKLEWQHEIYEEHRLAMYGSIKTIKNAKEELRHLQDSTDSMILSQTRIIACTTTKAAMCKHLLDDVSAGVVLVEEAAEIFESHILTSLSKSTKRLIMIGDHRQLRPKAQHYPLTVESNRDYDLNRSLFERLAEKLPTSKLGIQHRMHPSISAIPKLTTYPELKDAPSTCRRPSVKGLQSRLIFIDHEFAEDTHNTLIEKVDAISKTNQHEVEMVVAVVRYLFQQGYKPHNLVVLTPYLGQLLKIQQALSSTWSVFVDDLDFNEARQFLQGVDGFELCGQKGHADSSVRVATIDNYQGEEADIVIASLVRSNPDHVIGFLKEPERVNVLLSRARTCEIIIGNRDTLEGARGSIEPLRGGPLWKKIFCFLGSKRQIFDGLPVMCQSHGRESVLSTPAAIVEHSPDGGCSQMCSMALECGHPCTKRCHVGPCAKCIVSCPDKCPRGHSLVRRCSEDPPLCRHVIAWKCPLGHSLSGFCFKGKNSGECGGCERVRAEEEAQLRLEQKLQGELDVKHRELEASRVKLQRAQREDHHTQELSMIEEELVLVERQLTDAFKKDVKDASSVPVPEKSDSSVFLSDLNEFVRKTLDQSESKSLAASEIAELYRETCGGDLQLDANRYLGNSDGTQMRFQQIFESLTVCEVVSAKPGKKKRRKGGLVVQLHNTVASDASTGSFLTEISRASTKTPRPEELNDRRLRPKKARIGESVPSPQQAPTVSSEQGLGDGAGSEVISPPPMGSDTCISLESERFGGQSIPPMKDARSVDMSHTILKQSGFPSVPTGSQKSDDLDVAALVSEVVKRFLCEGALAADNLLDEIKAEPSFKSSPEFQALQYLIEEELDPSGLRARPPRESESDSALCTCVCLYSYSVFCFSQDYPLQARQYAEQVLAVVRSENLKLPEVWLERAGCFCQITSTKSNTKQRSTEDTPAEKWSLVLTKNRKAPAVMQDSILPMIGLSRVKNSMVGMYHRIQLAQEQNDGVAASYNIRFEGNPGTGKTTIARHYGTFLQQLSVLPETSIFKETSGAKLINNGISGLTDILDEIKKTGGGVLFLDEAYQLATDREGQKVLDFILPLAESLDSEYGLLVWIFAGYKKDMEKLFDHNVGLRSRFPHHFVFDDYSDNELRQIFEDMMKYQSRSFGASAVVKIKRRSRRKPPSFQPSIQHFRDGSKKQCRFSRTWTFIQYSGWTDELGNRTVDPAQLGKAGSELVDPSGEFWEEENGEWFNVTTGKAQKHYPGEPKPEPTSSRMPRPIPFHCKEDELQIAIRRLGRCRGERGFANARAVRNLFDTVRDRQAARVTDERDCGRNADMFELERTDLLGPDITEDSLKKSNAWKALEKMEGLLPVKESVEQLFRLVLNNTDREKRHQPLFEVALNRLFLGNPGTGKTSVAKVYGQILADLGLLSKGEVIYKCASDFVGDVLGASEKTTRGIIQSAQGCVLVIDEAYALYSGGKGPNGNSDPYKTAVIDTIVELVQAKPGADIAVVMLGYQAEMENMLAKVNPGLSRRFQLENAFHFPDFDDSSLIRIMMAKAREQKIGLSLATAKRAVRTLAKARAKPNFGNAGAVDNLLSRAISCMQVRSNPGDLTIEDFGYSIDGHDETSLDRLFDDLIGCKEIRKTMEELRDMVVFSKAQGKSATNSVSFNYLFLGSPGTGKTTVARRMGKMFEALGLLPGSDMKEIKASELLTGYVGQAGMKTRELLRESLGGVLFVDEAYQLDPGRGGSFMTEAVDELVGALTEEEFKGKLLVILAGYDRDMEAMLSVNPGLKSRFSERIHFHDFDTNATVELLQKELEKRDIPLETSDMDDLCRLALRLVESNGFGNGRDVVTWADRVFKQVAKRYSERIPKKASHRASLAMVSTLKDADVALDILLASREVRLDGPQCTTVNTPTQNPLTMMDTREQAAPPPPAMVAEQSMDTVKDGEEAPIEEVVPESHFDAINNDFLQSLQDFVEKEGLDSEDGVERLAGLDPSSEEFKNLLQRLVYATGMTPDTARDQLNKWQSAQKNLKKTVEASKSAVVGARPIWRCAVCGRANKPWIACYVAPYIVGYEQMKLGDM